MKDVYKLLSEYNELNNTTYVAFYDKSDGTVTIKHSKDLKPLCIYISIDEAIKDIKKAVKGFKLIPKI